MRGEVAGDPRDDLEVFARVAVELAAAREDREQRLARLGLDEDAWEAIEEAWDARLAEAEDAEGPDGDIPALVAAHAQAFADAQGGRARTAATSADAGGVPFERFVALTRAMQRGGRLDEVLAAERTSLETYLAAHAHWTRRMLEDPALHRAFQQALG